jgi:hypothetical protein
MGALMNYYNAITGSVCDLACSAILSGCLVLYCVRNNACVASVAAGDPQHFSEADSVHTAK